MRRSFAQVLREGKIDIRKEYTKLYHLFYHSYGNGQSYAEFISQNMQRFQFCGTCLDLEEFDEKYGFHFDEQPQNFDIDYFVNFCEYIYNFAVFTSDVFDIQLIYKIVAEIGYMLISEDQVTILVPKDNVAIAVSESAQIPQNISYKIISYNHYSMKGNLQEKKNTLLLLAGLLEPKRKELDRADKSLSSNLFYLINNLNLRHNNIAFEGSNYRKVVAEMPLEELEQWYDEIYQIYLLAFMRLEQVERKVKVDELKVRMAK